MIEIGRYNELQLVKQTDAGFILTDGDREVLLPENTLPEDVSAGDDLFVFVYLNKEGRLVATTKKAYACVGDFAYLKVVDEARDGVFIDMGIDKDLFVPKSQQKRPMHKGDSYVVYVYLDEDTNRLVASSRLSAFVEEEHIDLDEGDEVSILISDATDLGFNAIINNRYIGLLYQNELYSYLHPGDVKKAWIKRIRVDGKIDLSLQPMGYGHILDSKEVILQELKKSGGVIPLGDKSSPEDVHHRFQISKNAFKKTIGALYKERLIQLSDHEIRLVQDNKAEQAD